MDRRLIANFDWLVFGTALLISLAGIMTIFSATRPLLEGEHPSFYIRQAYWLLIGLAALALIVSIDYIRLGKASYILYAGGLILLLLVLIKGRSGLGAQRWLSIGPLGFQPSELFKPAFIIMLARYMSMLRRKMSVRDILIAFSAFLLLPLIMLLRQPDLGTAVIMLLIFMSLTLAKGVERKVVMLAVSIALISVPFIGNIFWDELKDYQKKRLVAFIEPEADPAGVSYHINQSKVAIGSGGVLGKGYLKGTQGPFRFLPEKHTDFVFSVFAEEWGLLGSSLLLLTYLVLILRGLDTAKRAKDEFGRLLALGITFMFTIYCFVNIGMTLGLMPVVGIPLPFMSYGGTALVSNFVAAGILINVRARRFELFY